MVRKISPKTQLYGVIGSPVGHSLSPLVFNHLFTHFNIDAVYLAFTSLDVAALFSSMRALNIAGYSITLPHKTTALSYVDALDPPAKRLGAINTAVNTAALAQQGKELKQNNNDNNTPAGVKGYNFDGVAAVQVLAECRSAWQQQYILLIGAGGSARGIAFSLVSHPAFTGKLCIASRNALRGNKLVTELQALHKARHKGKGEIFWQDLHVLRQRQQTTSHATPKLSRLVPQEVDVIIQTTPLGMGMGKKTPISPPPAHVQDHNHQRSQRNEKIAELPLDLANFRKETLVYDIIYTPLLTAFLQQAQARGMPTLSGLTMFLAQALMQFKVFTGITVEKALKEEVHHLLKTQLANVN